MADMVFTDGKDERFVALCGELDQYLDELVGCETQQAVYNQYNTLEAVRDAVLIVENGQAVACGAFKEYASGTAEIKRVFAKPQYRGRGYGKAIMEALEARARELGYARLILETGYLLSSAVRLYKALGYTVIPNYGQYACMENSICMEKKLV